MRRYLILSLALLAVSGCSTMFSKPYQTITVETPGVEGAYCALETPDIKYAVAETPDILRVERAEDTLVVTCNKPLYHDKTIRVESMISGNTFWNVFNGVIPGTTWDTASGAIYAYPSVISVELDPDIYARASHAERLEDSMPPSPPQKKEMFMRDDEDVEIPDLIPVPSGTGRADTSFNNSLRK